MDKGNSCSGADNTLNWRRYSCIVVVWWSDISCSCKVPSWLYLNLSNKSSLNLSHPQNGCMPSSQIYKARVSPSITPMRLAAFHQHAFHWYQSNVQPKKSTHRNRFRQRRATLVAATNAPPCWVVSYCRWPSLYPPPDVVVLVLEGLSQ